MKLEVGEFYLSASGEVIEIIYKEDKVIKEPNYAFFDTLGKMIMFFVKAILIFFTIHLY